MTAKEDSRERWGGVRLVDLYRNLTESRVWGCVERSMKPSALTGMLDERATSRHEGMHHATRKCHTHLYPSDNHRAPVHIKGYTFLSEGALGSLGNPAFPKASEKKEHDFRSHALPDEPRIKTRKPYYRGRMLSSFLVYLQNVRLGCG